MGLDPFEAAQEIELCEYSVWSNPKHIAVNVDSLYREFSAAAARTELLELMGRMVAMAGFGTAD